MQKKRKEQTHCSVMHWGSNPGRRGAGEAFGLRDHRDEALTNSISPDETASCSFCLFILSARSRAEIKSAPLVLHPTGRSHTHTYTHTQISMQTQKGWNMLFLCSLSLWAFFKKLPSILENVTSLISLHHYAGARSGVETRGVGGGFTETGVCSMDMAVCLW